MTFEKQVMDPGASRIVFLDGLRGYAIVMVVATHAIAYANLDNSIVNFLSFWVQAVAVPPFFLADGFLFVRSLHKKTQFSYLDYCARSARRLLLPWISFSILYVMFRAGFEFVGHPQILVVRGHTPGELTNAVYYSSVSAQLYFLPALFLMRSISFATRYLTLIRPVGLLVVWLAYVAAWQVFATGDDQHEQIDPVVNAAWGMQYYLLGMALSMYEGELRRSAFLLAGLSLAALVAAKVSGPAWVVLAQYAYICGLLFTFLGLSGKQNQFTEWGAHTMGIYLIHAPIVVKFVSYLAAMVFDQSSVVRYLIISSGTFLISLAGVRFFSRFAWWRYMLGEGRKEAVISPRASAA